MAFGTHDRTDNRKLLAPRPTLSQRPDVRSRILKVPRETGYCVHGSRTGLHPGGGGEIEVEFPLIKLRIDERTQPAHQAVLRSREELEPFPGPLIISRGRN